MKKKHPFWTSFFLYFCGFLLIVSGFIAFHFATEDSRMHTILSFGLNGLLESELSKGVDPNLTSSGKSLLEMAVLRSNDKAVEILLKYGSNPNQTYVRLYNTYILHYAVYFEDYQIVELLLRYGADPLLEDPNGKIPSGYSKDKNIINLLRKYELRQLEKEF